MQSDLPVLRTESDMWFSHESPYCSRTGASPESPFLARRSLHALSCGFPTSDIYTTRSLPTHRGAAQVSPGTGTSTYTHTPGIVYRRGSSRLLPPDLSNSVLSIRNFRLGSCVFFPIRNFRLGSCIFFCFSVTVTVGTPGATSQRPGGRPNTRLCVCQRPKGELSQTGLFLVRRFPEHSQSSRQHMWG
jgi:hypothetical protein